MNQKESALSFKHLQSLVERLNEYLQGARLQSSYISERFLWLEIYQKGPLYLGFHTLVKAPTVGVLFEEIRKPKKILKKPLSLFLSSHAVGHKILKIKMKSEFGRVFSIFFGSEEHQVELEVRLIPHAFNLVCYAENKRVALAPIKDLLPAPEYNPAGELPLDIDRYLDQWREMVFNSAKASKVAKQLDPEFLKTQRLEKKRLNILKIDEELIKLKEIPWERIGEHLKQNQKLQVPEDWEKYLDIKASFSSNLQMVFHQHRVTYDKIQALLQRRDELENELKELDSGALQVIIEKVDQGKDLLKKAKAAGRKLKVRDDLEAVLGKSAKDNLAILRQAQAWDLWVHLKDLPGSHAVLRRKKKENVTQQDILKVGRWVLEQSLGPKRKPLEGERYDLIYCECRFVKPIKGDKLGRVNYANAQTLTLKV